MAIHRPTYIYSGIGTSPLFVDLTQEMLETVLDTRGIKRVDQLNSLDQKMCLLVFPGGHAGEMMFPIEKTSQQITQLVEDGSSVLAICGGAMLFTEGGVSKPRLHPTDISDKALQALYRQGRLSHSEYSWKRLYPFLSLPAYHGRYVAPHIVKNADTPSHPENLCAVEVTTLNGKVTESFKVCHYSGPAFLDISEDAKVMLRYQDPVDLEKVRGAWEPITRQSYFQLTQEKIYDPNPVAAFSYTHGKGKILLTGIHPEMDYAKFPAIAARHCFPRALPVELEASEHARLAFVHQIFTELGIH